MVGRQRLSRGRVWLTVSFFPLLIALLFVRSLAHPASALALAGGVAAGVALAGYGLRHTRFERTPLGWFYTPNAHVGIALSLLLVARIGYRAAQMYFFSQTAGTDSIAFLHSPLTLVVFGMLAGYYVAYAIGLFRWWRQASEPRDPDEP